MESFLCVPELLQLVEIFVKNKHLVGSHSGRHDTWEPVHLPRLEPSIVSTLYIVSLSVTAPQQLVYTATVGRRLASSPPPSQPGPPQVATIGRSAGSGDEVSAFSLAETTSTQHLEQVYG